MPWRYGRRYGATAPSLFHRGGRRGQPDARGQKTTAHGAAFPQPPDPRSRTRGWRQVDQPQRARHRVDRRRQGPFLDHARLALTQAEAAAEAARRAAKPPRTLFAIGFLLDRIEDLRLRFRQVAPEIAPARSLAETSFIAVEDNPGGRRWRRKCFCQRRVVLSRIRRARRGGTLDKSACRS